MQEIRPAGRLCWHSERAPTWEHAPTRCAPSRSVVLLADAWEVGRLAVVSRRARVPRRARSRVAGVPPAWLTRRIAGAGRQKREKCHRQHHPHGGSVRPDRISRAVPSLICGLPSRIAVGRAPGRASPPTVTSTRCAGSEGPTEKCAPPQTRRGWRPRWNWRPRSTKGRAARPLSLEGPQRGPAGLKGRTPAESFERFRAR